MSVDLHLEAVSKSFAPDMQAVDGVTLHVAPGEYVVLVGPSGCGKTTLLRMIAGLETPTAGRILINDDCVNDVACHLRGVAMFFQRPALIPNQTVRHHLSWPSTLRQPWTLRFGSNDDLTRIARLLNLDNDLDRPVEQLSGGQQQRVALGRCLLHKVPLCLLDEPLGHLDAPLRTELRRQIRALMRDLGVTVIHVTHDPDEAFSVGDRVAVMQKGQLIQVGTPSAIRRAPSNRYVTELIHHQSGGLNFLTGEVRRDGMDTYFECLLGRWPMSVKIVDLLRQSLCAGENFHPGMGKVHIIMGIAVEDVHASTSPTADPEQVRIVLPVQDLEFCDQHTCVISARSQCRLIGCATLDERFERRQDVTMTFSIAKAYWFDAEIGRTLALPTG